MTKPQWSRLITAGGAALLVTALALGALPGSASADAPYTAQASGRGLQLGIAGVDAGADALGPRSADTDRTPGANGDGIVDCVEASSPGECRQGPGVGTYPNLPILANILSVGVIAQDAAVDDLGNSRACAGIVGPGGLLTIDETPEPCLNANPTDPGGIMVNLVDGLPLGLLRLRIDGVYAECTATAGDGAAVPASASGDGGVANVVLDTLVPLLGWTELASLPISTAPNSSVVFPVDSVFAPLNAVVQVAVNEQVYSRPDAVPATAANATRVDVTALRVTLLGAIGAGGLIEVKGGQVSCGTNTATAPGGTTSTSTSTSSTNTTDTTDTTATTGSTTSTTSTTSSTGPTTSSTTSTSLPPIGSTSSTSSTVASSTSSSSSTSTTLAGSTTSTSTAAARAKAPLAQSGVNTRTQLSVALGLLGVGLLVTGRGMQLGFDGSTRRRR